MKKEKTKIEKCVERFLLKEGYRVELVKQYASKSIYHIEKNGINETIEIPYNIPDCKKYMKLIDSSFKRKEENLILKKKLETY